MNVRVDVSSGDRACITLPLEPRRALAQAFVVPMAESVSAIMFDETAPAANARPRLMTFVDGQPVARPVISTSLALRSGGRRHLQLVGREASALASRHVTMSLGGTAAAQIDPEWLQPPLVDGAALIDGLSDEGRRRLLKLFLTTGASLFGSSESSEFGRAARRLLDLLGVRPAKVASFCPIGHAGGILSYDMPRETAAEGVSELVALAAGRVTRLADCPSVVERTGEQVRLHVYLMRTLAAGSSMIGLRGTPVHLLGPGDGLKARPLLSWLRTLTPAARRWALELVERASDGNPVAAALVREIRHDGREPPELEIRHLSGTPKGVLYDLELRDPHDLIRAVRIERDDAAIELEPAAEAKGALTVHDLAGYAGLARQSRNDETCRLRLVYRSGRLRTVHHGLLDAFGGEVPRSFAGRPGGAEAAARARFDLDRPGQSSVVEDFGAAVELPKLSIIAGVGENLDMIRARAAMLFAEPRRRRVELVYHVADGPLAAAGRTAMANAAAVFGIPHRLVVLGRGADMADRLLAAVARARGDGLLVMGADVLPAGPGWLAPWTRRLGASPTMLGGTLLTHCGAVAHAGAVAPGRSDQRPEQRYRGLPACDLPRRSMMATALVSAECVGLSRAAATLVLAMRPYPNPDIMLAEAADRLRLDGKKVSTLLHCRFVRYAEDRQHPLDDATDTEALRLALNPSFAVAGEKAAA